MGRSAAVAMVPLSIVIASWLAVPTVALGADVPGNYNGRILVSGYVANSEGSHIYTINPDGTGLRQLTFEPTFDVDPVWSPDQTRIAFARRPLGSYEGEIWLMNADGSDQHVVATGAPNVWNGLPTWSPDGAKIAYRQSIKGYPDGVFRFSIIVEMDANGGNPFTLVDGDRTTGPIWSPTGDRIAYWKTVQFGTPGLHTISPVGSGEVNLYPDTDLRPQDWSPDGASIIAIEEVYPEVGDRTTEVYRVSPTGGSRIKVVTEDLAHGTLNIARYSPDGRMIAFAYWSNDDLSCDVYAVKADGSGTRKNLTFGQSTCLTLSDWGSSVYPFVDTLDSPFRADIAWVAAEAITSGCATLPDRYCPFDSVTRGQMASFLARALALPSSATDYFTDDETSIHETDINRVAKAGIASGCGGTSYCPTQLVTRGQMASFLARAFSLPSSATDYFSDDETSIHETDINRVAKAGITSGCTATTYCPLSPVTRGQMAAFLHRALV